ncbi:hypothetical protein Bca52824_015922 [Brassica carinata]|uniref:Uncharacterized protein n=1 Tax=Brassica carinata TaxID=52824 RepID=A0A8X7W2V7_BRACI|nr:hypothetical protein Bca52824_015922 [Brassica carinata]
MGDENPRIMYGVIITVYVDRRTTVRSFRAGRRNECTWKREIGMTGGYDRRAYLLARIRQLRAEGLACDLKGDDHVVESNNKPERKTKKRRWLRKVVSQFRLPFRRENKTWKYRHFDPDEEEGKTKSKAYSSDLCYYSGYHAAVYEVEETHMKTTHKNIRKHAFVRSDSEE